MSKPTVLVVDDCDIIRASVSKILRDAGYLVIQASDGEVGLGKLGENPDQIDLIILDVNMPRLDGFGFCVKLNEQHPSLQHTPIIFLTSEESFALEMLGQQMGSYLKKPVNEQSLLTAIQTTLSAGVGVEG